VTNIGLPAPQTVTITIASPAQITATTAPVVNTPVVFSTNGALPPTGITAGTTYYVINPTATTFNIAATMGGSAINTSGSQSGVQIATFSSQFADALNISSNTKLSLNLPNIAETAVVSATASTGTINYDVLNQSVLYYTTSASGNWTLNVRGNSLTTLNSLLGIGQSLTLAFLATQGSTAYYETVFQIDGSTVIPKWAGGIAPTNGNINAVDVYTYTIFKTASATYTVFATRSKYA
jgi:hypothetical protein